MTKLALVRFSNNDYDSANEHLGIGYLAAATRNAGIDCKIFDSQFFPGLVGSEEQTHALRDAISKYKPTHTGYTVEASTILAALKLREAQGRESGYTIFGGPQLINCSREFIQDQPVDFVISGEGETTLPTLINALNTAGDLSKISGITYKDGKQIIYNQQSPKQIPTFTPQRDVLEKIAAQGPVYSARVSTSRGCRYDCHFCTTPADRIDGQARIRYVDANTVVDEIQSLQNRFGVREIYLNDDLYFSTDKVSREHALNIAREIKRRNLKVEYKADIRANSVKPGDSMFLSELRESGLDRVFVGFESGSDSMLQFLNKHTSREQNEWFVNFMTQHNISVNVGKILFGPYTDWTELNDSIESFSSVGLAYQLLRRPNSRLEAFPGTMMTRKLIADGLLEDKAPYLERSYEFANTQVSGFETALRESFESYYKILKPFYKNRVEASTELKSRMNKLCADFFRENIALANNWNRQAYDKIMSRFVKNLEATL